MDAPDLVLLEVVGKNLQDNPEMFLPSDIERVLQADGTTMSTGIGKLMSETMSEMLGQALGGGVVGVAAHVASAGVGAGAGAL